MRLRATIATLVLSVVLLGGTPACADTVEIEATPIRGFAIGTGETRLGALEFVGGLELRSPDPEFGGISGFRLLSDRNRFLAVSDAGRWFAGTIVRDAGGVPAAITEVRSGPLLGSAGNDKISKRDGDCEGLAVVGNEALLSFERNHRILRMRLTDGVPQGSPRRFAGSLKKLALSYNKGIEAVAAVPAGSPIPAEFVAIAEETLDAAGNHRGFLLRGAKISEFSIRRHDGYAVTDADFLPNGDLLVLERSFSFSSGPAMRLRRIVGPDIKPGALVDGVLLLEADARYQIDNMEALSVSKDESGGVRITLGSDNNFSVLQRTLLLEFRLVE